MADRRPLVLVDGQVAEMPSGDMLPSGIVPGGGGGGSVSIELNGAEVVSAASVLNFTGGVSVSDAGGGRANISITGSGGGGGVPTIVQSKIVATSNIASGITLDGPPAEGNILIALCLNSTGTAAPSTAAGWTSLSSSTALPDHNIVRKKVGAGEAALQTPTGSNDGGVLAIYEVTGTVAIVPGGASIGTASTINIPFTSNDEYAPAAAGLLIGFSGRRTDESGTTWSGSLTKDMVVAGSAATTGGTGVSASTSTGALVVAGAPSSSCLWPSSAATLGQFVLVA